MPGSNRAHSRRARWWSFAAAVLLVCAVSFAGCGGDATLAGSGPGRVAEFVPAGSQVYVEISTDLDGGQWRQATDLLGRFPAYRTLLRTAKDTLAAERVEFDRDIRPLLGEDAAVAVPDVTRSDQPPVLLVVDIEKGKQDEVLRLLRRDGTIGDRSRDYRGVTVHSSDGLDLAVFDDCLVASTSPATLDAAIDARKDGGDRSLAGTRKVRQALSGLPNEALAHGYIDLAAIVRSVGARQGPEVRRQIEAIGIDPDAGLAISLSVESHGLRMKAVASKVDDAPVLESFSPSLTEHIPSDAVAYLGAHDLYGMGRAVLARIAEGNSVTQDRISSVRGALTLLGLPPDELKNLLSDEAAVALLPANGSSSLPGAVGILRVGDAGRAAKTLDGVRTSLPVFAGSGSGLPRFARVGLQNGVTGWEGGLGSGYSVVYGVDRRLALIGSSADVVRSAQSPRSRLSDDQAFRRATDQMPSRVQTIMWIDVDAAVRMADRLSPRSLTGEARRNLAPVRNIAGWSTVGDHSTFEVFATIG